MPESSEEEEQVQVQVRDDAVGAVGWMVSVALGGDRLADVGLLRAGGWAGHPAYSLAMSRRSDLSPSAVGGIAIELATEDDLPPIVDIVNYTAAHSIATFATRPISVADRRDWFQRFAATGPYRALVARDGDKVLGYACTQQYRDHEAFRETVEVSIALDAGARGRGIGTRLYRALFESLAGEPVHVVVAGIALPNDGSVALHQKFGFTDVGVFRDYAVKNGQYISSLWLQRILP